MESSDTDTESSSDNNLSTERNRIDEGLGSSAKLGGIDAGAEIREGFLKSVPKHRAVTSNAEKLSPDKSQHHRVHFTFDDWAGDPAGTSVKSSSSGEASIEKVEVKVNGTFVFTRRQWLVLFVIAFAEFFSAVVVSLQAPFYPAEAEKKGITPSEYGLVFGIFEFTVFLVSFVYGKYMDVIGPRLIFNLGLLTTGTCSILFGFLDRIDDRTTFFALSMVTRIVEAIGDAGFVTASFTLTAMEFPNCVATTFATLETFFGLGLICGPTIGGFLFQIGGYTLPFATTGILLFLAAIMTYFVLPKTVGVTKPSDESLARLPSKGLLSILRNPSVAVAAFSIFMGAMSIGFLSATLEPHIREFGLNPVLTGLVFIISGGMYAFSAPFWGWLCDRSSEPKYFTLIGSIFIITGFLLVGPAPFIPLNKTLWLTGIGLGIIGLGLGATLVTSFITALKDVIKSGFPDNVATYGLLSGLWMSFFALGNFVGPSLSGILYDTIGFPNGSLVIVGLQFVVLVLVIPFLFGNRKKWGSKTRRDPAGEIGETDPLLG